MFSHNVMICCFDIPCLSAILVILETFSLTSHSASLAISPSFASETEVAKALKADNGKWLNELEELTKKTVIVKSDPALHQEQFDVN